MTTFDIVIQVTEKRVSKGSASHLSPHLSPRGSVPASPKFLGPKCTCAVGKTSKFCMVIKLGVRKVFTRLTTDGDA